MKSTEFVRVRLVLMLVMESVLSLATEELSLSTSTQHCNTE